MQKELGATHDNNYLNLMFIEVGVKQTTHLEKSNVNDKYSNWKKLNG